MSETTTHPDAHGDLLTQLGRILGRHTALYLAGTAVVLPVSLVNVAVLTRYLSVEQFRQLSLLFFLAGGLTIVFNLVTLQGAFRWVYMAGEGEVGDSGEGAEQAPGGTKSRALGTAAVLTILVASAGGAVVILLAPQIADGLLGRRNLAPEVRLAALSAVAGALFRFTVNVVRMERRPLAYSVLTGLRPFLALGIAVPLVALGGGVNAAILATIIGSAVPTTVAFALVARSYRATLNWSDARAIGRLGNLYVGVVIGLWIVHNADPFLMNAFGSARDVGIYRVASRIASVNSYGVSAFFMAWAPLERSPLFQAAYESRGKPAVQARMLTYYVIVGMATTVLLALTAPLTSLVAASTYRPAQQVIPLVGLGFVAYGSFIMLARITRHRMRDLWHNLGAMLAAAVYIGAASILVPPLGTWGLAAAMIIGSLAGAAGFVVLLANSPEHVPIEWLRIAGAAALGCATVAGWLFLINQLDDWALAGAGVGLSLLYVVCLWAMRIIPPEDLQRLRAITRAIFRIRPDHPEIELGRLEALEADLIRELVIERRDVAAVARAHGIARSTAEARVVQGLCAALNVSAPPDRLCGATWAYLIVDHPVAEADLFADALIRSGVARVTLFTVARGVHALTPKRRGRRPLLLDQATQRPASSSVKSRP